MVISTVGDQLFFSTHRREVSSRRLVSAWCHLGASVRVEEATAALVVLVVCLCTVWLY